MMIKVNYVVAVLVAIIVTTGCGGPTKNSEADNNSIVESTIEDKMLEQPNVEREAEQGKQNNSLSENSKSSDEATKYEGSVTENGEFIIEHVDTNEQVLIVPDVIDGAKVVEIGPHAFDSKKSVRSITLPDTVKRVDSYAFSECIELETIDLGKGIEYMGDIVFNGCSSLKMVSIPEGATSIGAMFYRCTSLKEVYVPTSVTEITGLLIESSTCPDAVIVTPSGSFAEAYAIKRELNYRNE